jgi:oligoendopeptidase F
LAEGLVAYFELDALTNRLTLYGNLQRDGESTNPEYVARHQAGLKLTGDLMTEASHLRQAILGFSAEQLDAAYRSVSALASFRPYVDGIRRRADRVLSAEGERVLSLAGDNLWAEIDLNEIPSTAESAFAGLISDLRLPIIRDEENKEVRLTLSNYGGFRSSPDRRVRRDAVAALFGTLRSFENTLAATLAGQAQFDVFLARARKYDTALEAYLDKDEIDTAVHGNLIRTVRANLAPLHRYVELRREAMGVDEVHLYDLYIPLVSSVALEIPYAEAVEILLAALEPMGAGYGEILGRALDVRNGWIDLYPSKDKQSGAFSASAYGVHPYVKMNYLNRFDDVSTLAHELGHAVHSDLSMRNQPYMSFRYVPFLAEIASTANEALLSRYMISRASTDAERAWLLSELLETIRTTIYRQTLFVEFELRFHELAEAGEPITAEKLNGIYAGLIREYYGPAYTMDENDAVEWAYIPHFYWKYYVYNYATGLSSGIAIAERVLGGEPSARDDFLQMLSGGNSKPPLELLRGAGVDLTKPDAIEAAIDLFERTRAELQELLKKK